MKDIKKTLDQNIEHILEILDSRYGLTFKGYDISYEIGSRETQALVSELKIEVDGNPENITDKKVIQDILDKSEISYKVVVVYSKDYPKNMVEFVSEVKEVKNLVAKVKTNFERIY